MNSTVTPDRSKGKLPRGIVLVAVLTILFGLAEVKSGLTHNFMGLTTSQSKVSTFLGVSLGLFYFTAGLLILVGKKWAATIAVVLLIADVVGRITMVTAGFYPLSSFLQAFAIIVGTAIAALFAVYIAANRKLFQ